MRMRNIKARENQEPLGALLLEDGTLAFGANFMGGGLQNQTSNFPNAQRETAF